MIINPDDALWAVLSVCGKPGFLRSCDCHTCWSWWSINISIYVWSTVSTQTFLSSLPPKTFTHHFFPETQSVSAGRLCSFISAQQKSNFQKELMWEKTGAIHQHVIVWNGGAPAFTCSSDTRDPSSLCQSLSGLEGALQHAELLCWSWRGFTPLYMTLPLTHISLMTLPKGNPPSPTSAVPHTPPFPFHPQPLFLLLL